MAPRSGSVRSWRRSPLPLRSCCARSRKSGQSSPSPAAVCGEVLPGSSIRSPRLSRSSACLASRASTMFLRLPLPSQTASGFNSAAGIRSAFIRVHSKTKHCLLIRVGISPTLFDHSSDSMETVPWPCTASRMPKTPALREHSSASARQPIGSPALLQLPAPLHRDAPWQCTAQAGHSR